jgi:hypothetical protein
VRDCIDDRSALSNEGPATSPSAGDTPGVETPIDVSVCITCCEGYGMREMC